MSILVPKLVYAGDTVIFDVPAFTNSVGTQIDSGTYTLKWYARTNVNHEGATITGVAEGDGWRITVPSSTTTGFDAGTWTWQAVATEALSNTQLVAVSSLSKQLLFTQGILEHLTIAHALKLILKK